MRTKTMDFNKTFEGLVVTVASQLDNEQPAVEDLLEIIIRQELSKRTDTCMSARISEFLVKAIATFSILSAKLTEGEHIVEDADARLRELENIDGLSELDYLNYMSDQDATLRTINTHIQESSAQVTKAWKDSAGNTQRPPKVQECFPSTSDHTQISPPSTRPPTIRSWDHEQVHMLHGSQENCAVFETSRELTETQMDTRPETLEDDSQGQINELIKNLSARGKGDYTCPLRYKCCKSGLNSDGSLKVFVRNSAFRAHLEKHGKMYKCDIPGCRNKDGFARKDQLARHQEETSFHQRKKMEML